MGVKTRDELYMKKIEYLPAVVLSPIPYIPDRISWPDIEYQTLVIRKTNSAINN